MGEDAEVFVFHHAAYLTTVVPAFAALLRGEPAAEWLTPFLERRELKPSLWKQEDLRRYGAALNADLSWAGGPYDLEYTYGHGWNEQWSNANNARVNDEPPDGDTVEQLNWLFKIAISIKCVGASQFVGRSKTVSDYLPLLSEMGVNENDRIVTLLAALGKRGFLIGYQFGFGFEGVNGWLDPSETAELAEKLDALPLPRFENSFAAMQRLQMQSRDFPGPDDISFAKLSLWFLRTTAAIAAQEKRGLLWGNGVMPREWYLEHRR